jgi:hypothetical protein
MSISSHLQGHPRRPLKRTNREIKLVLSHNTPQTKKGERGFKQRVYLLRMMKT